MKARKKVTKRDLDALETRMKVFNEAIKLFSERGFDSVTVDDITQSAGVAKGTFYTYFQTKESVLVEQFHLIDSRYLEEFGKAGPDMTSSERLHLLVDTMTDYCANVCGVNVMKVVYMNQISIGKRERILRDDSQRPVFTLLRKILETGVESKEFNNDLEIEVLMEYTARFIRSLIYDWCLYDGEKDLQKMGKEYIEIIIKWLKNP